MTDKQIIIDVCPYQGECSVSGCKRNDDGCFVRQLFEERYRAENQIVDLIKMVKAKEQECEELAYENYELNELFDRLKAENEKLDTENKRLVGELANPIFDSFEELDILKQTLTEIKEIAKRVKVYDPLAKQILQKISKCEGE